MQKILILILSISLYACTSCNGTGDSNGTNMTLKNGTQIFPEPVGRVNDFANVLDSLEIIQLEKKLRDYEKRTTNQVAIVSINIDTLHDENFDQFSLDLTNHWGVGIKDKNNGLSIVFSPKLRRIRINTGLGTEKILSDEICEEILQTTITPEFSKENYFQGLDKGTDAFFRLWK